MIVKIGDFKIDGVWVESIDESLELNYAEINRVNNNPYYQDIGEYKEGFSIKGEYIKEKASVLDALEDLAKAKSPVRYTTLKDSFLVVITSIKKNKKTFLKGAWLENGFEITLKRWYW